MAQTLSSPLLIAGEISRKERGKRMIWIRRGGTPTGQLGESSGQHLLQMWAHVGLQDPKLFLSEVRAPFHQLPLPRVQQHPFSDLRGQVQYYRQGGRGDPQGDAEGRAAVTRGGWENTT